MMTSEDLSKRRYQFIVILWIILAFSSAIFLKDTRSPFIIGGISDPQTESALAQKIITDKLPYGGSHIFILYKSDHLRANDSVFRSEVHKSLDGLKNFPFKHRITSPYQNSHQISKNQHVAYAIIALNARAGEVANSMEEFRKALGKPKRLEMYIGGQPTYIADVNMLSRINLIHCELLALPLSILVLVVIFRGLLAALLPIISGIISITIILAILYLWGRHFELSIFVENIASMLGLALTLDYTLLITYRFREELTQGHDWREAIRITLKTAGKSVFFSGLAVLISTASLLLFPLNILYSIGVGGVIVVIVAVLSSLTFLPALLCLLDENINVWSLKSWQSEFSPAQARQSIWFRIAMTVMKYPLRFFIPGILFLLFLGYPFLQIKLTYSDASILPKSTESRQLLDQFKENFNANEMAPINILFKSDTKSILKSSNIGHLYDYARHLKDNPDVQRLSSIVNNLGLNKSQYEALYTSPSKLSESQRSILDDTTKDQYTVMSVISKYSADDERTFNLVRTIRQNPIDHGITQQVGGTSASIIDAIKSAYHLFFKTIIAISIITYIVLLVLLRSIILPLKAIMMNFLSLCVCYGMLVFIFQEGHLAQFLHFEAKGTTDLNLPILLFFGLFGLSMDYEVFLLTRIKEFYQITHDNTLSVALGLERSGRIITSAALLVIIVAGSFAFADIIFIKAFGLGTALAVGIDASIIRMLLVPATMRLLGKWNWYLPKWLDRLLPNI